MADPARGAVGGTLGAGRVSERAGGACARSAEPLQTKVSHPAWRALAKRGRALVCLVPVPAGGAALRSQLHGRAKAVLQAIDLSRHFAREEVVVHLQGCDAAAEIPDPLGNCAGQPIAAQVDEAKLAAVREARPAAGDREIHPPFAVVAVDALNSNLLLHCVVCDAEGIERKGEVFVQSDTDIGSVARAARKARPSSVVDGDVPVGNGSLIRTDSTVAAGLILSPRTWAGQVSEEQRSCRPPLGRGSRSYHREAGFGR